MTMRTYTLTLALLFMAASLPAQFVTFKNGDRWEVNNPFKLDEKARPPRPIIDPSKASFDNTFEKLERKTINGGIEMSTTKKISEAILIEWPIIQSA